METKPELDFENVMPAADAAAAPSRPSIGDFQDPVEFLKAMLEFRKQTDKTFTVVQATRGLRKISPSLVSLVLNRKRKMTFDRADEFAKVMGLNIREKIYFRNWLARIEGMPASANLKAQTESGPKRKEREEVGAHLLNDWINVYVKDCFQIEAVQKNPDLVYQYLASHAEPQRIKKALAFLLREGYLRRTLEGHIVVETNLATATTQLPSKKIRQFHIGAFSIAKSAMDLFPPEERLANTLIVPLNPKSYGELVELIQEFSEKLQDFAALNQQPGERLYQLIVNLSPTGGKIE